MKMQHTVAAPRAGTVTGLSVAVGTQVAAGEVLAVVAADPPHNDPDPTDEEQP
jgi:propionyl-CoA carboxylase alpha chain